MNWGVEKIQIYIVCGVVMDNFAGSVAGWSAVTHQNISHSVYLSSQTIVAATTPHHPCYHDHFDRYSQQGLRTLTPLCRIDHLAAPQSPVLSNSISVGTYKHSSVVDCSESDSHQSRCLDLSSCAINEHHAQSTSGVVVVCHHSSSSSSDGAFCTWHNRTRHKELV